MSSKEIVKKNTSVVSAPSQAIIEALRNEYPEEQGFVRNYLPRLGMFSQDVTEGKGKAMKVVTEAGTFFVDRKMEENDAKGKIQFEKNEIGDSMKGVIIFQRRQLRHYDEATEEYTSSPIFDFDTDVVKLFKNKKEVASGTAAELKALAKFQITKDGKTKSALEENKILYVVYGKDHEIFEMNLRGSSMYSYKSYAKELHANEKVPSLVLTKFTSEACEKGDINWNKMMFSVERDLTGSEAEAIFEQVKELKSSIAQERSFFANKDSAKVAEDKAEEEKLNDF